MGQKPFKFSLTSFQRDFPPFAESFQAFCQEQKIDSEKAFELGVSLEELIVNSFTHGKEEGPVQIWAFVENDEIKVTIEDEAPPFNLLRDAPPPPKEENILDRRVGGLGIHLVKSLNDRVEYVGSKGGNKITLFKKIAIIKEK